VERERKEEKGRERGRYRAGGDREKKKKREDGKRWRTWEPQKRGPGSALFADWRKKEKKD
jgi:hypothetical protein